MAASVLTSGSYNGRGSDHSAFSPYRTEPGADKAYEMAGLGPEDVDLTQVHDAATIGELQQIESLQLTRPGEAWRATLGTGARSLAATSPSIPTVACWPWDTPSAQRVSAKYTRQCSSYGATPARGRSLTPRSA